MRWCHVENRSLLGFTRLLPPVVRSEELRSVQTGFQFLSKATGPYLVEHNVVMVTGYSMNLQPSGGKPLPR